MSKRKLTDLQRFILRHLAQSEQGLSAYTLWSRFKLPADNVVEAMNPLVEQGLVRVDGARISLSEEGVGFINERRLGLCQREERPWRQCPPEFREAPIGAFEPVVPVLSSVHPSLVSDAADASDNIPQGKGD